MALPLHLFVDTPISGWTLATPYGRDPANPDDFFEAFILKTTAATANVRAAVDGKLSTRHPDEGRPDADSHVDFPADNTPLPARVLLYLKPTFGNLIGRSATFRDRMQADFAGLAFRYLIDTASLSAAIGQKLAAVPLGADAPVDPTQLMSMFVNGLIDVQVTGGQVIGTVAQGTAAATFLLFGVGTDEGSIDPADFYDQMRDFVDEGQAQVDALLGVAPSVWPILGATRNQVVNETAVALYPYSVLQEARTRLQLSRADWRLIGDQQKKLFRDRLKARVGAADPGATAPPFAFNDVDFKNVFQLESIAEFYVNFREPWAAGAVPLDPATNVRDPNNDKADVGVLDFLNFAGTNATVSGTTVTLNDPSVSFDDIRADARNGDVIVLDAATARAGNTYRITAKSQTAGTVTVDLAPAITGGKSTWTIKRRPQFVLIDAFGARSSGQSATVTAVDANGFATVQLDVAPRQVNAFFDTIYFPADTASPRRTYRVLSANGTTLVVQGSPSFTTSTWDLQAGLGGDLDPGTQGGGPLPYNLGPLAANRGNDHFDGTMFIIYDETVRIRYRWNSYTGRNNVNRDFQSTIDGNRGYDLITYRASNSFRNFALKVVDFGRVDQNQGNYDTCTHARFFFDPLRRPAENAAGTVVVDANGKTTIRIHFTPQSWPHHGASSAGCIVSYVMEDLRTQVVNIIEAEFAAVTGAEEPGIARLRGATQAQARAIYGANGASRWGRAMAGTLWLIRPDQLPIGYARPAGF